MKKKKYEVPTTVHTEVELENGFMKASIFEPDENRDEGVSIEGHEIGNTGDYTDIGWDQNDGGSSFGN
ncbi:hypothetical protein [uncultured Bacteroides sp.]|jgi:hypothetical protein|uniref:hypothetical protein n=1 Tax=uncultured Bacteroides sp. TaxID=162156 RepID=UPI0026773CCD|nr:hypothetical protein [uncultured Bacteroides sp.]